MTLSEPIYFEYDMAISFAGEDRAVAEDLAEALSNKGVEVFYDKSFKIALLGRELADDFRGIYASKTRFAVVLISRNYLGKDWTNFEFSIIREEAKKRKSEFILPVRLDDINMFGIPEDMAYLDYRKEGIDGVVNCLLEKLIKAEMHDLPAYAKLYQEKGNLDRELLRRQELLKIRKEKQNKTGEGNQLGLIGHIYRKKGDLDLAKNYFEESRKIFEEIGNEEGVKRQLENIKRIDERRGELPIDQGKKTYQEG